MPQIKLLEITLQLLLPNKTRKELSVFITRSNLTEHQDRQEQHLDKKESFGSRVSSKLNAVKGIL